MIFNFIEFSLHDDIFNFYNSGNGFEFLIKPSLGLLMFILISFGFLCINNCKNLYYNTLKYLKRDTLYRSYYMFALMKNINTYFMILALFDLIYLTIGYNSVTVDGVYHITIYLHGLVDNGYRYEIDVFNNMLLILLLYAINCLFDTLLQKSRQIVNEKLEQMQLSK